MSRNASPLRDIPKKTAARETNNYRDAILFEAFHFQNVFRPHENEKPAFLNSFGLKSILENA